MIKNEQSSILRKCILLSNNPIHSKRIQIQEEEKHQRLIRLNLKGKKEDFHLEEYGKDKKMAQGYAFAAKWNGRGIEAESCSNT